MMVRKVAGPYVDAESFLGACPVLDDVVKGGWSYVGDPNTVFGWALRVANRGGFKGVFQAMPRDGWKIWFIGTPMRCGSYDVEILVAGDIVARQVEFYYQVAARYGRRLTPFLYSTGDDSF